MSSRATPKYGRAFGTVRVSVSIWIWGGWWGHGRSTPRVEAPTTRIPGKREVGNACEV